MQPFLYQLWYLVFSLLGNYNYFFFAAHLLDVAVGVAALRIILEAITYNGKQLMLTVFLLTIVVYIYTVVAFNFFRKFYVFEEEGEEADQKCHDMFTVSYKLTNRHRTKVFFYDTDQHWLNVYAYYIFSASYSTCIKAFVLEVVSVMSWSLRMEIRWKPTESSLIFPSSSSLLLSCLPSFKVGLSS